MRRLARPFAALGLALGMAFAPTTVRGQEVLPQPQPPFKGKIGRTAKESTPDFPKAINAPKGAPNVLLILTDDVGFGASSTFGGPIPTPTFDKLAKAGLRYNQFHTTALCSPTRAALISGRNHHTGGTGTLSVDGKQVAQAKIDRTIPIRILLDETFDVGMDTGTPVVEEYVNKMPFKYTGGLKKVVIELGKSGLAASDQKKLDDAARAVAAQE